jgi:iron complex outermembrane receptor protein
MKHEKLALSLLTIAMSVQVQAQTLQEEDIERILISGSRIAESIDEVPSSVTIISQKELQDQLKVSSDIQSLLSMYVPGISAANGTSSNFAQTLRGRAALIMIDGVPQSTPLRNGAVGMRSLDPNVIERIEVIKGATSIYGNGAAGGIINYITKKTNADEKLNLNVSLSSRFSAVEFEDSAGVELTVTADGELENFSYVAHTTLAENGVLKDADGDALGTQYGLSEAKIQNYFTKLGYQFDDEKRLEFTYNYYESQQNSDWVNIIGDINKGEKTYAIKDASKAPSVAAAQGPRGNHNAILKYTDDTVFANTELAVDLYKQSIENVFFYSTVLANPDLGLTGGQSLIKSEKQGLRGTLNSRFDWDNVEATFIYGVDLLEDISSQPMVDGRVWVPEMDMNNIAGFLQSKWVFNDDFIVKAGIRYDNIDISVDDYTTLKLCRSAEQCSIPMDVTGGNIDFNATTYNVAVRYNAYEKFSPYISYSEGANVPDLGALLRRATVNNINLVHTQAAIIDNIELGFVSNFDNVRFELSTYISNSDLGSSNVFNEKTGVYHTKRAPQEIWGYEGTLNYTFNEQLNMAATYSYVEGKHADTDIYLGGRQISAPKGTVALNWSPTEQARLTLSYLYVGDRDRFSKNDEGNYTGDEGAIDGYNIMNASGSYDFGGWSVFAGIENLFNQDYFPARSQALTYRAFNVKGLGTTVNLGVKAKF